MGDSDHRRDEDESRGVRDRSRSPERGGGGDGGYGDGRPAYDGTPDRSSRRIRSVEEVLR